ncbi:MAG: sigma-70 family RNA polymerase sigma factor [Gemmataceae bacterium]|nr:sigma-70 family RNA polymerase sigma factor [Gemmataceae bacterium]MDW8265656.1 sigma-70 family RNA polymerase sigma factor [Gemmataceae bacterium]
MDRAHGSYPSVGSTSSSLLRRVQARDGESWCRLVRVYGPLVAHWLQRAAIQHADAEDVFQEIFRAVARSIGSFRQESSGGHFRAWLRTITRSKLAEYYRRQAACPEIVGGSGVQNHLAQLADQPPETCNSQEGCETYLIRRRMIELVKAEFKPNTWLAFWKMVVEGLDAKSVAEELGMTPAAVRMAKSRVLKRLRNEMAGLED